MENDRHGERGEPPDENRSVASSLLGDLTSDRRSLAARLVAPAWLYPAFGLITALYVAAPLIEPAPTRRAPAGLTLAATLILVWGYQRLTGVRVSRASAPARATLVGLVCATLLLLSASFGLKSFGLDWWIILPAAASFALTVALGRLFHQQYRAALLHGH